MQKKKKKEKKMIFEITMQIQDTLSHHFSTWGKGKIEAQILQGLAWDNFASLSTADI